MRIVFIVSDTFRYDHLGYVRRKQIRTPDLDKFIADSMLFDRCYASSFPTIPNREDLFTGCYGFPFHGWAPLSGESKPMAEILQENGYLTQLIADTPHLTKRGYNYDRGFQGYYWIRGQEGDAYFTRCNYDIETVTPHEKTRVRPSPFGHTLADVHRWVNREWTWEEDRFVARTTRTASKWLEQNYKIDDFLLWVDCFDVHEPWDPPQYLVDLYDPDYTGPPMLHPNYGLAEVYTEEELKNLQAHYAAEVTLVDKWVGHLIRKIKDLGIYDETLIVFTSDHGMYLGEHNRTGKSNLSDSDDRGPWPLYEELAHIPLIIHAPGFEGGKRSGEIVQSPDILPTILDLAKIKQTPKMHGYSLLPLLEGKPEKWPRKVSFSSRSLSTKEPLPWTTITNQKWSLLIGGRGQDKPQLFNLKEDPGQQKNIFEENLKLAEDLKNELGNFLKSVNTDEDKINLLNRKA